MSEFRIVWWPCPTSQHRAHVNFVEAADEATARAVVKDYIERVHGITWFTITEVAPYTRPQGGKVIQ